MKKFRVYLKEGKHIDVMADHFTFDYTYGIVTFFKSKDEVDTDILIWPNQTVAVVPFRENENAPSSGRFRM